MKIQTAIGPSHWASYLINGDSSGLEPAEKAAADSWLGRLAWGFPVTCEDMGFCRSHDAMNESPFAGDCQRYGFLVRGKGK